LRIPQLNEKVFQHKENARREIAIPLCNSGTNAGRRGRAPTEQVEKERQRLEVKGNLSKLRNPTHAFVDGISKFLQPLSKAAV